MASSSRGRSPRGASSRRSVKSSSRRSASRGSRAEVALADKPSSRRGSRRKSGASKRSATDRSKRRRGSGSRREEKGSGKSRRSSARENRRDDENSRTQRRRGGTKKKNNQTMIYGGVGALSLILVIGFALAHYGGKSPHKESGSTTSASTDEVYIEPTDDPYASVGEARKKFREARKLAGEAQILEGRARNQRYKAAARICRRVMATAGISDGMRRTALKLYYSVTKHQTLELGGD